MDYRPLIDAAKGRQAASQSAVAVCLSYQDHAWQAVSPPATAELLPAGIMKLCLGGTRHAAFATVAHQRCPAHTLLLIQVLAQRCDTLQHLLWMQEGGAPGK